jgi:hypothetical protein
MQAEGLCLQEQKDQEIVGRETYSTSLPTYHCPSLVLSERKPLCRNVPTGNEVARETLEIIALCKKVGHGHFSCHTSVLRRFRPGNTFLSYLYNNTMYSYNFSYIWNLLFELEMLVLFLRNLHHYKKSKFQKGGLDDIPPVAHPILNRFKIGNVGFNLYCYTEVHAKFYGGRLSSCCFIENLRVIHQMMTPAT